MRERSTGALDDAQQRSSVVPLPRLASKSLPRADAAPSADAGGWGGAAAAGQAAIGSPKKAQVRGIGRRPLF
jgi:hypothetical protein